MMQQTRERDQALAKIWRIFPSGISAAMSGEAAHLKRCFALALLVTFFRN
jgi:hypothetical protein